jgi:hypothetical protein
VKGGGLKRIGYILVLLPPIHFLAPAQWLAATHLDHRIVQLAVCAVAALCVFGWAARWATLSGNVTLASSLMLGLVISVLYVGLLEIAQSLTPDRHARFADFEWNAVAVVLAPVAYAVLACVLFAAIAVMSIYTSADWLSYAPTGDPVGPRK